MIYITGDTHCEFRRLSHKAWDEGRAFTKDDYVIIAGDFGLLWKGFLSDEEIYWTTWLNEKPWTTLFVSGNHENYTRLKQLTEVEMFEGKVGKVSNSIFHLKTGEVYMIPDKNENGEVVHKRIFTFGGAASIDKHLRREYVSWWPEENPSYAEMQKGLENLEKHNNEVDVVITHTIPLGLFPLLGVGVRFDIKDVAEEYLGEVRKILKFKKWYFGHWHINKKISFEGNSYHGLYEDIVRLEE